MKLTIFLLLSCVLFVSGYVSEATKDYKYADKDFLVKQKFFLDIFRNMHSDLQYPEYIKDAELVEGENNYYNYHYVKDFYKYYKFGGMLKRGEIFTVMNKMHREEMQHVFNLFFYSKDWTTFYKNVIWARMHINEGMFVYALTSAVLHRKDLTGFVLPPLHEICPYKFFNGEVINDAIQYKLHHSDQHDYVYYTSNTTQYFYHLNEEQKLSYFTEDIGLNAYYYYFNMDYPFWMGGKDFDLHKDRRGEHYLYFHQQLLARYYMERLTNGMGEIDYFDWHQPIHTGYYSGLRYYNGIDFPVRDNNYHISSTKHYYLMDQVQDYERRIRDVIDSGHLTTDDNTVIDIRDYKGIDYLGNLIQGNPDNVNNKFYRYVMVFSRFLVGGSYFDNYNNYKVLPSVLEHYETSMRDPVFYQLYKKFIQYYWSYKSHFDAYTHDELNLNEVQIENVKVDNLITYFDYFDSDITNAVDMDWSNKMSYNYNDKYSNEKYSNDKQYNTEYYNKQYKQDKFDEKYKKFDSKYTQQYDDKYSGKDFNDKYYEQKWNSQHTEFDDLHDAQYNQYAAIRNQYKNADYYNYNQMKYSGNNYNFMFKTRQMRLNHYPFYFNLDVTSQRAMKVVVRGFMGPKYDKYGNTIDLHANRQNFVEFDQFYYDLKVGKTTIKRNSKDFYWTVKDRTTYSDLYKYVMSALNDNGKFPLDMSEAHCGFPDRLLLPKGSADGYHMQFFFIINEYKDTAKHQGQTYDYTYSCGVGTGNRYIDDLPMGYPFDRQIDEYNFYTKNMYFKDVTIFHKTDNTFKNYVQE